MIYFPNVLKSLIFVSSAIAAIPCFAQAAPLDRVCLHVGASFDTDHLRADYGALNNTKLPDPVPVYARGLAYALYGTAPQTGISWFSAASAGAPSTAFRDQAEQLLRLIGGQRVHCAVIGLTAEFFSNPRQVGTEVAALVAASKSRGILPVVVAYPPITRLREPARSEVARLVSDYEYNLARTAYSSELSRLGAVIAPIWDTFQPGPDGLHPTYASSVEAAKQLNAILKAAP